MLRNVQAEAREFVSYKEKYVYWHTVVSGCQKSEKYNSIKNTLQDLK